MDYEEHIKLIIPKDIFREMQKCSGNASPNEAGGLVFGDFEELKIEEGFQYNFRGKKFECLESTKPSPVSYLMDNLQEFYDIWTEAIYKYKQQLVSIFHSHPGSAMPSGFDDQYMKMLVDFDNEMIERGIFKNPNFKYVIWTIIDGKKKDLKGFLILKNKLTQIEVIVEK